MKTLRRLLDSLSVYLPLLVMALLASASWWLVRSAPVMPSPTDVTVLRQEPDYRLSQFTVKSFNRSGHLQREVSGEQATHYPATQALHIGQIRVYAKSENGAELNAQSAQGIAADDGSQVTLMKEAVAVRHPFNNSPRIELRGERLVALPEEDRVVSDDPVRITRDRDVFTAQTMDFNSQTGQYLLQGRVRGSLAPQP